MNETTKIPTRQSYGEALAKLGKENKNIVVLDADLSTAKQTYLQKKIQKDFSKWEYQNKT